MDSEFPETQDELRATQDLPTRQALMDALQELQHERNLVREARRQWLDTVDSMGDPIMVHDGDGRIVRANKAYTGLAGLGFQEMLGRCYWECFPRREGPLAGCVGGVCVAGGGRHEEFEVALGQTYSSRVFTMCTEASAGSHTLHIFVDITQEKREKQAAQARTRRAIAQAEALSVITSSEALLSGDVEKLARAITEQMVRACGVKRANVWLFNSDETQLDCIDHFDATAGTHSLGLLLMQDQFENEFRALKSAPYVAADDALTDSRTSGYVEGYLKPNRITSMLDSVVAYTGKHLGVLCLEHVDQPHHWKDDEIVFAGRMAEKIAIAISNRAAQQSQQAMRASELRFRTIFEQAPVGISESSITGRYLKVNQRLCEITGYSEEELRGRTFRDTTHLEDLARDEFNLAELLSGQASYYSAEKRYLHKTGKTVWVSLLVTPMRDASGAIERLLTIAEEITARKEAEAEIRALARFPHEDPNPVMRMTAAGRLLYANPASVPLQQLFDAASDKCATGPGADIVRDCLACGKIRELEMDHDGRTFSITVAPIMEEGYANIYGQDITERKRAQQELERRERYYRKIIEGSSDVFFVIDRGGNLVYRSESGVRLTGYESAEVVGNNLAAIVQPGSMPEVRRAFAESIEHPGKESRAELRFARKDGSEVEVEAAARNLTGDPDVNGIVVTVRDITERKVAEAKLRNLNRALKTLSTANVALVHATGEDGLLKEMTRILREVGGYPIAIVGYANDDRSVVLKACSGVEPGAHVQPPGKWADNDRGQSAVVRAIRLGQVQLIRDAQTNATDDSWREIFRANNVSVTLGLPLRIAPGARPFGAIGIGGTERELFDAQEIALLEELADDLAYGVANLRSAAEREATTEKLRRSLESTIDTLAATMETRDPYTAGHQRRVAELAAAIATEMGLPAETIRGIHFGALIHDIGKMQVPSEILSKPTRLTKLEFELIKIHAEAGYDIIKDVDFPWPVALMVRQHHERLDGSGYPQGLKGDEIALEARILSVADVVEAMSSHRPYRAGLGVESALAEIESKRGIWFDPAAVDACLRLFREKKFSLKAP